MEMLPLVKYNSLRSGVFKLNSDCTIYATNRSSEIEYSISYLREQIKKWCGLHLISENQFTSGRCQIVLDCGYRDNQNEAYTINVCETIIKIKADSPCGLFRGVTTLIQIIKISCNSISCCEISDWPDFEKRGILHDITRGKVPLLEDLKETALKCAFYKINQLQLYIEHSYAFSMLPEFKKFDPISAEEILELDEFCRKIFIDLVPALATFGHLYELLRIKRFAHLNELDIDASVLPHDLWDRMAHYTIYPGCEDGFELIKSMIKEIMPLFSSKYFNICADETFDLGKGKSKYDASRSGLGTVYAEFVKKLLKIVIDEGKTPMMWGDIVCNHPEILPTLPKETIFLNWGYGADITSKTTEQFAIAGVNFYVCPGVQGWSRFANNINDASMNIRKMVQFGKRNGASGVLNTNWGDCGHVNFTINSIYGIALGASLSWNSDSPDDDSEFDRTISILEWGQGCERIATMMRQLGSLTWYHFGNMYAWVNKRECLWYKEVQVETLPFDELLDAFKIADAIKDELQSYLSIASDAMTLSLCEHIWSASAISWTCMLLIFKKSVQFNQTLPYEISKERIISDGIKLFDEFVVLWRKRNKESELRNVISTFRAIIENIKKS